MEVSIHYAPTGWAAGRVRDMSTSGVFITLAGIQLPAYAPVTVILDFHGSGREARLELPAIVVRTDDNGIGVMFLEHDAAITDGLRWIIAQWLGDGPLRTTPPRAQIIHLPVVNAAEELTTERVAGRLRA